MVRKNWYTMGLGYARHVNLLNDSNHEHEQYVSSFLKRSRKVSSRTHTHVQVLQCATFRG